MTRQEGWGPDRTIPPFKWGYGDLMQYCLFMTPPFHSPPLPKVIWNMLHAHEEILSCPGCVVFGTNNNIMACSPGEEA